MILDWETNHLFLFDRLEGDDPQLFACPHFALNDVPIEIIPGTSDISCRGYVPVQFDEDSFCQFIYYQWWLHAGHAEQENHLTKHDGEIATLQRDSDRILAKLDEILRELQGAEVTAASSAWLQPLPSKKISVCSSR